MVFRVYVEKKPGFDVEAQQLAGELRTILGLTGLKAAAVDDIARVEGINRPLAERIWASLHGLDAGTASDGAK